MSLPTPYYAALFGVNRYASRVPDGWTWHIWDKRDGLASNMLADAEILATSWQSGPTRIFVISRLR